MSCKQIHIRLKPDVLDAIDERLAKDGVTKFDYEGTSPGLPSGRPEWVRRLIRRALGFPEVDSTRRRVGEKLPPVKGEVPGQMTFEEKAFSLVDATISGGEPRKPKKPNPKPKRFTLKEAVKRGATFENVPGEDKPSKERRPGGQPVAPDKPTKPLFSPPVIALVRDLRARKTPWKDIPPIIEKETGERFTAVSIRFRYNRLLKKIDSQK